MGDVALGVARPIGVGVLLLGRSWLYLAVWLVSGPKGHYKEALNILIIF